MTAVKAIFGWLLRQSFLLLLIVAALAFYQFAWPRLSDGSASQAAQAEWKSPAEVRAEIAAYQRSAIADTQAQQERLQQLAGPKLADAIATRKAERARTQRLLQEEEGLFASISPSAIIAREERKLRIRQLDLEIATLETAGLAEARRAALRVIALPGEAAIATAQRRCADANRQVRNFNALPLVEKFTRNQLTGDAERLTQAAKTNCSRLSQLREARARGLHQVAKAERSYSEAEDALQTKRAAAELALETYNPAVTQRTLRDLVVQGLLILLAIMAAPFTIRTLLYYCVAPAAERHGVIRISVPGDANAPIPLSDPSRVSLPITLEPGEELLVRQDYLQTSSSAGEKRTRWLLDYRHPVSSLATGLAFLTRIGGAGETTTVSAVRDPFAELTQVTLTHGAAVVLHPRGLVAVVQPEGKAMRITSHWRLGSISAWLTLQLRYMVFHGPGRLVVKGGRGIRVERAENGRVFGQDQLVGFGADLDYSVTRTETFAPYFFGRVTLFKDKVEQGGGVLIVEEAPLSVRSGSGVRRGMEGTFDAALKAFGL